jgi:NAD(P)H-hydrate epimerase
MSYEILSNEQMANADRITIDSGVKGFDLMQNAGNKASNVILERYKACKVIILCGPGNNGGDGFIIAQRLLEKDFSVDVYSLIKIENYKGDALLAAKEYKGEILGLSDLEIKNYELVVDALFGTGFSKELDKELQNIFIKIKQASIPVVAIDIPSGVNGSNGETSNNCCNADLTITFCRKKIGHVLMPGMEMCGDVIVCDIGIPDSSVKTAGYDLIENNQSLWKNYLKAKKSSDNKYNYGHCVIFGGSSLTGAARLAAEAAMRIGAGLCTISCNKDISQVYRTAEPHVMVNDWEHCSSFVEFFNDSKRNAALIGPGAGVELGNDLADVVIKCCSLSDKAVVLDADAITVFKNDYKKLYKALHKECVLTPHEGEFKRIFPSLENDNRIDKCKKAAKLSNAVVLLKGADTIIADPDGRAVVNINGTPDLATGGSGDILAGLIVGLMAQGIPAFESACIGAFIHGKASQIIGHGLVASDIPNKIPEILSEMT